MKFSNHSDEESCGQPVTHETLSAKYGEFSCLRTAGHPPPCEAIAYKAAELDGVRCWVCRARGEARCFDWCTRGTEGGGS